MADKYFEDSENQSVIVPFFPPAAWLEDIRLSLYEEAVEEIKDSLLRLPKSEISTNTAVCTNSVYRTLDALHPMPKTNRPIPVLSLKPCPLVTAVLLVHSSGRVDVILSVTKTVAPPIGIGNDILGLPMNRQISEMRQAPPPEDYIQVRLCCPDKSI